MNTKSKYELPIPAHFDPVKVGEVWRVLYEERAKEAAVWAKLYNLKHVGTDKFRICLMPIDCQNTFCIPGYELFVGGRSGTGAVDDNQRLAEFIYRNLGVITEIAPTMDTHMLMQIFHAIYLVNDRGEHPAPYSLIKLDDIENGVWRVNPAVAYSVYGGDYAFLQRHLLHYARSLKAGGKYDLTVWPYHAMLGGISHALAAAIEEACFFHAVARSAQTRFEIKGGNPLFENYSVLRGEVLDGPSGEALGQKNTRFIKKLLSFDAVVIAGQAKSHCVAWTIDDLLREIAFVDHKLAEKVYLLEDCTSPVVVPNVIDYTVQADAAFQRFDGAGMHVVRSTEPIESWPGIKLN